MSDRRIPREGALRVRLLAGVALIACLPALPTLHPAFLLRQPQAKRVVWADMLSLAARLDTAQVEPKA